MISLYSAIFTDSIRTGIKLSWQVKRFTNLVWSGALILERVKKLLLFIHRYYTSWNRNSNVTKLLIVSAKTQFLRNCVHLRIDLKNDEVFYGSGTTKDRVQLKFVTYPWLSTLSTWIVRLSSSTTCRWMGAPALTSIVVYSFTSSSSSTLCCWTATWKRRCYSYFNNSLYPYITQELYLTSNNWSPVQTLLNCKYVDSFFLVKLLDPSEQCFFKKKNKIQAEKSNSSSIAARFRMIYQTEICFHFNSISTIT